MKKIFSCLSFLCIINLVNAQDNYFEIPDSLKQKTAKELISRSIETRNQNIEHAIIYTKTLLQLAINTDNEVVKHYAYLHTALNAKVVGDYETTIRYAKLCINYFKKDPIFFAQEFQSLTLLATALEEIGKDPEATTYFLAANSLAEQSKNPYLIATSTRNLGKMKRKTGRFEEALADYKKANTISPERKLYMGIGGSYLKLNQPDSALVYSNKGLQEALAEKNIFHASYYYIDIGIAYFLKQDYHTSLKNLNDAKELIHNEKRLIEVYFYIGNCYYLLERYEDSIDILQQALQIIKDNEAQSKLDFIPYEYTSILELLADNYHKIDDDASYELYRKAFKERQSTSQKEKNSVNDLIYTAQIKKEKDRNDANKFQYYRLKQFTIALCIIFIISSSFLLYRAKKRKAIFNTLNEKMLALERDKLKRTEEKSSHKKEVIINNKKTSEILARLEKFEEQEFYLDPNCNLRFVAKKVKTNATYLTKIIHTHKEKKFIDYINYLRITYTLKRLNNDLKFRAYSIKSISEEVGYKSTDSFTKHFKKHTKLYPSYYIKTLNKKA
ncbi:tetratricopeptide repeat protein [uncultured Kordia sp.]|uniref:tetratricopeptide repeat protein n=1 Tax=uncultured Kordia sp. TaxID=507699 RepID=UPI002615689D|nr:tetratricopeptide repeat protein [uncultured Kordia sp.]